jgi:hypothetical protein
VNEKERRKIKFKLKDKINANGAKIKAKVWLRSKYLHILERRKISFWREKGYDLRTRYNALVKLVFPIEPAQFPNARSKAATNFPPFELA